MNNLLQRVLALVGAGIAAVVVFLLATVGFVVALVVIVVLAVVVFIAARRNRGGGRFVIFTSTPSDTSSPPFAEKSANRAVETEQPAFYDLSPDEYSANDKPPDHKPQS